MEEKNQQARIIDLVTITKRIYENRTLYYKVLPIVFVLACFYILSKPRYYRTEVKLAPELGAANMSSTLGSLASSFGFDFGNMQSSDAITPLLYPDLMNDNLFVTQLFSIKVKDSKGTINTTYKDYLHNHQKYPWWTHVSNWVKRLFPKSDKGRTQTKFDPYYLSKNDNALVQAIQSNIEVSMNKKNGVISIMVQDQDPLICRTIADSAMIHLQRFITEYRTNKARIDYEYYLKLTKDAKSDYERIRRKYGSLGDAYTDASLKSVQLMLEDYENEMQLKFNAYSTLNTQLQTAQAKVQENTPAFTVIQGASVPLKPAGPKRMIFVGVMLFLAFIATSLYVNRDLIFKD
jgi:uncharacterized protein involved in exopolysaccharide biosynthesis